MPGLSKELEDLKPREDWSLDKSTSTEPGYILPPAPQANKLYEALHKAAKSTPRYLFRRWTPSSGGYAGLNTTDAITPLAFFKGKKPRASMYDMDSHQLHQLINGHLSGEYVKTPFSSWSHSLPMILSWAHADPACFVSVIDTHQLKRSNFVFHCGATQLRNVQIQTFGEEFLIFGVIERGHSAVPIRELQTLLVPLLGYIHVADFGPNYELQEKDKLSVPDAVVRAMNVGRCLGPDFELPVAIHLLAAITGSIRDMETYYVALMKDLNVPAAWAHDVRFPNLPKDREGRVEYLAVACKAMAAIVERLRGDGRLPSTNPRAGRGGTKATEKTDLEEGGAGNVEGEDDAVEQEEEEESEQAPADTRSKHLKKSSRIPKEVYQLYIDMLGFETHNDAVKG